MISSDTRDEARTPRFDASTLVDDALVRYPHTAIVFNAFGIDTCCGGGRSLAEAAQDDGVKVEVLLSALRDAVARG